MSGVCLAAVAAVAQVGPGGPTGPSTAPTTKLSPTTVSLKTVEGTITPADRPVDVPYRLSYTNHLIVRLKINGRGPFNFVVDTGAPTMMVDETVAADIGLKPDVAPVGSTRPAATGPTTRRHRTGRRPATQAGATTKPADGGERKWATIDRLDIEGGLSMSRVKCLILTPYQLTGMNASGVPGVELHGLLGYSVLARFKMDIDLSRNHMVWTPQVSFTPPPLVSARNLGSLSKEDERREDNLESMGSVMKVLGPLVKMNVPPPPKPRGYLGIELSDATDVLRVGRVMPGSPADRAGVKANQEIVAVDGRRVRSAAEVQLAESDVAPGKTVTLTVTRQTDFEVVQIKITAGEGL